MRPPLTKTYSSYSSKTLSYTRPLSPQTTSTVPDEIIPRLYLSDLTTATKLLLPTWASNHPTFPHIKYVLTVLSSSIDQPHPKPESRANEYSQKLIILDDDLNANLLALLDDATDWMGSAMDANDGGLVVHCHLGQSRSASIVIAYIMKEMRVSYTTALERVKRKRAMVRPNLNFAKQLDLWESMECKTTDEEGKQKEAYVVFKDELRKRTKGFLDSQ